MHANLYKCEVYLCVIILSTCILTPLFIQARSDNVLWYIFLGALYLAVILISLYNIKIILLKSKIKKEGDIFKGVIVGFEIVNGRHLLDGNREYSYYIQYIGDLNKIINKIRSVVPSYHYLFGDSKAFIHKTDSTFKNYNRRLKNLSCNIYVLKHKNSFIIYVSDFQKKRFGEKGIQIPKIK